MSHRVGDLGADSLDVVEIGMNLEETFNLTIPDEKWDAVILTEGPAQYRVVKVENHPVDIALKLLCEAVHL